MKPAPPKTEQDVAFNSSLATLERINEYIVHADSYLVNDHIIGFKKNLFLLYVHSRGFLTKPELLKADKDWNVVDGFDISVKDDELVVYDDQLYIQMVRMYKWLVFRLHKHKVTMASKKEGFWGVDKIMKKYGLSYGED